jgi:hypothetical protein
LWRTTVHSQEVEVDGRLRSTIDEQLLRALDGLGRIGHVYVRLYGRAGEGLQTCHIRVDVLPTGGVALGDSAEDVREAVEKAAARIGPAVRRGLERGQWPGTRRGDVRP